MYMQYFVGLTLVVCAVEGSLFRSDGPSIDPDQPDSCYSEYENLHVPHLSTIPIPGKCGSITCEVDFSWVAATCPAVAGDPLCFEIPEDLTKPYPDCCPTMHCP